ncbi:AraC family transcriptional regulator [uncultured Aquimarina sp.]|uniref:helix-turn-helix domain-containing protein n=1 Tax=uncultured Aquimarina sp. TaxID=575652 RepID=UPI0026210821|nr:AraC family transcriptional regulator [uncultured Aquimarina sp.]
MLLYNISKLSSLIRQKDPDLIVLHLPEFDQVRKILYILQEDDMTHITILWYPEKDNISETELVSCYDKGIDFILDTSKTLFLLQAKINGHLGRIFLLENHLKGKLFFDGTNSPIKDKNIMFMDRVYNYLSKNYSNTDFCISKMGYDLGMSRTNFYSHVKSITKMSPSRMVMTYRLKIAATLLKEEYKNISEIAFDVGFASTSYFIKCFKEVYEQKPSDYRRKKTKNH